MQNISVVITFYNKGEDLIKAVESVNNQLEVEDEIIVINDCSTDESSKKALLYAKKRFPKIYFNNTPENRGSAFAKDYGIKHSRNEIIVLLDADDTIPEFAIKSIRKQFEENPNTDIVFGNYILNIKETKKTKQVNCKRISKDNTIDPFKLAKNWILLGTSPFKKTSYIRAGGFDYLHPKTDDFDFHRRLIVNRAKFSYLNKNIYVWNKSTIGNNSSMNSHDFLFSFIRNIEFYFKFMSKYDFFIHITYQYLNSIFLKLFNKSFKRIRKY